MEVLDHGYVRLLDSMGDDWTPVRAARLSYGKPLKGVEADTKLLKYLLTHGHTSPFEQVVLTWEMKLPIFVARQLVRYRTASLNEFSMRYADPGEISDDAIEYYTPAVFLGQSGTNKQASAEPIEEQGSARGLYERSVLTSVDTYRHLISLGVSREQARCVLPVTCYTKWVWTNDLHNTLHLLDQRLRSGAQWETRQYAYAMLVQLRLKFPIIMSIWEPLVALDKG